MFFGALQSILISYPVKTLIDKLIQLIINYILYTYNQMECANYTHSQDIRTLFHPLPLDLFVKVIVTSPLIRPINTASGRIRAQTVRRRTNTYAQ